MDTDLPPLIRSLLRPGFFPDVAGPAELIQTHISWVLLAGEFAYKIKKPLQLPFLDFSTLALRHAGCKDELRLNRRFAPDLYLDVLALYGTADRPQWQMHEAPIEYLVRMRRFDESGRLDHLCARGELRPDHLSDLALHLAQFHAGAPVAPPDSRFGRPAEVRAPALENFQELLPMASDPAVRERLDGLLAWTHAEFDRIESHLQRRKAGGHIRECHGDLHLANLVCIDGQVRMFDCLEFNEDLRWIDVASDIAFTYTDLLDHGQGALAGWFLNEVLGHSGDYHAAAVLRFYAVYRAMVRAKVAGIRSTQAPGGATADMAGYLALAGRLAHPGPARLIITHGLAGCGKTVASTRWLQTDAQAGTLRLRSDVERKRLFGLAPREHSGSATGQGIYAPEAHARTYAHLRDQAARLLQSGWSVLVDAAFLRRSERDSFRQLAIAHAAHWSILAPEAPPEVLRERIVARQRAGQDASEATPAVLAQQMAWIEPLDASERAHLLLPGDTRA